MTVTGHVGGTATNEWATPAHAGAYLERGPEWPPHRFQGEAVMVSLLPPTVRRVLDLGTGNGRVLALLAGRVEG
jgi:tRNA (cmo5U34)-methyltransferase